MTEENRATIIPAEYPELKALIIDGDPTLPLSEEATFALYERNWRFLDREKLTDGEKALIRKLTDRFGEGEVYV
ncbi:MAG: hypothetical protein ACOH2J_00125 [Allorhizobium sp.]